MLIDHGLVKSRFKKIDWRLFAVFVFFFILRVFRLGSNEFWYDETASVRFAAHPWGNWNAPLYWIVMHYWTRVFGVSEAVMRLPSALFSFFSLVLTWKLGKELFDRKTAFIAAIFMGLSPFHLWYAQEARDYSMVLFMGTAASCVFLKALKDDRPRIWLLFALAAAAGLYTNYIFIFLFAGYCLYLLLRGPRGRLVYLAGAALAFGFYLPRFIEKYIFVSRGFWVIKPGIFALPITAGNFMIGYNGFPVMYGVVWCVAGLFLARSAVVFAGQKSPRPPAFVFCLCLSVLPLLLIFIFSQWRFPVYLDRSLIIFSPYVYLILARGAVSISRPAGICLTGLLMVTQGISAVNYFKNVMVMPLEYHMGTYIKKPVAGLIGFLRGHAQPGDIVAFTNVSALPSVRFYAGKTIGPLYYFFDPRIYNTSWKRPERETRYHVSLARIETLDFARLWVVSSDWARSGLLDENSRSVLNWLGSRFVLESSHTVDGTVLSCYSRPSVPESGNSP